MKKLIFLCFTLFFFVSCATGVHNEYRYSSDSLDHYSYDGIEYGVLLEWGRNNENNSAFIYERSNILSLKQFAEFGVKMYSLNTINLGLNREKYDAIFKAYFNETWKCDNFRIDKSRFIKAPIISAEEDGYEIFFEC